jgi:hypothetical protein
MIMKSSHNGKGGVHVTETPDVSHIRNVDVKHEASDVYVQGIATFIGGLTVMTIVVYLLMWGMFRVMTSQEQKEQEGSSPMAMSSKERLPPEPRLQTAPGFGQELAKQAGAKEERQDIPKDALWEVQVLREHWKQTLEKGMKDPSGKVSVMPIEEAKKELLKQGLPAR